VIFRIQPGVDQLLEVEELPCLELLLLELLPPEELRDELVEPEVLDREADAVFAFGLEPPVPSERPGMLSRTSWATPFARFLRSRAFALTSSSTTCP